MKCLLGKVWSQKTNEIRSDEYDKEIEERELVKKSNNSCETRGTDSIRGSNYRIILRMLIA
jgi:hypothetical protein